MLAELTGLELGTETVRTHSEQVGAQVEAVEQATIAHVLAIQDPPPERSAPAPEQLVIETDGVLVHDRGTGWHEVKLAEIAGCRLGNGRPPADPAHTAPQLLAPSYTAARESAGTFEAPLLAAAACRGTLDVVEWE